MPSQMLLSLRNAIRVADFEYYGVPVGTHQFDVLIKLKERKPEGLPPLCEALKLPTAEGAGKQEACAWSLPCCREYMVCDSGVWLARLSVPFVASPPPARKVPYFGNKRLITELKVVMTVE